MNKKIPILLFISASLFSLGCCSNVKEQLTYGTYITQTVFSLKELNNEELLNKANNEKETFLLAVYQGSYSQDCLCWATFENIIASYMNKYHGLVYVFDAQEQDETVKQLKIEKINESTPMLYIFKGEKQLAKYSYKNTRDKAIFEDTKAEAMNNAIKKVVYQPKMYYVNDEYIKNNNTNASESIILFMRNGCGDCSYVIPNVLIPYIDTHQIKKDIWLFDLQDLYDLSKKEDATEEEKGYYQATKDGYGLSESNAIYGYLNGVVPTMHYYQKGVLTDSTVYFNDVIDQKEDGSFYISESYYSEERLPNFKYLKNCSFTTVLKGLTINEGILENKRGGYYWSQEAASKYHTPIFEAFLDYYLY